MTRHRLRHGLMGPAESRIIRWFGLAMALALLAGCMGDDDLLFVSLEPPPAPAPTPEDPPDDPQAETLQIGISPRLSPVTSFDLYAPIAPYLTDRLRIPVILVQRQSAWEIDEMVRAGEVAMAFGSTGAVFVDGKGLEPVLIPVVDDDPNHYAVCVVSIDNPARSLMDLHGASFGVTDPLSYTGRAYVTHRLGANSTDLEHHFERPVTVAGQDELIRLVAAGSLDGGCMSNRVLDQVLRSEPQLGDVIRSVEQSGPIPAPPVIMSTEADPDLREQLLQVLEGMHLDPDGQAILEHLGVDRFARPAPGLFDNLGKQPARGPAGGDPS